MYENRVLVTGAAGFLGGHVLGACLRAQKDVAGLVRSQAQADKVSAIGAEPVFGDVTDRDSLKLALRGIDQVIHLAAINRDRDGSTMEDVNYHGTVNLIAAARAETVERIIQVVGIGADSRRKSQLSRTQGLAVDALLNSGIPATVLESAVIYGVGDAFTTMLAGLARLAPFVTVPGNGRSRFEPIHAVDVAQAAVNALDIPKTIDGRFQIAGSQVLTLDEIIQHLLDVTDISRTLIHVPLPVMRPLVRLLQSILSEPPATIALLDLLALDILAEPNDLYWLIEGKPKRFRENISYLKDVTASHVLAILLGRKDRRGQPPEYS